MSEHGRLHPELGEPILRGWLQWLALEPYGCFLCERILFDAQLNEGRVGALTLRGVELTRTEVIAHLSQCVPERQSRAR